MSNWQQAFFIEQSIQDIMSRQAHYGVYFDVEKARDLTLDITRKLTTLESRVLKEFDYDIIRPYLQPVNKPFLKSGRYSQAVLSWFDNSIPDIGGPFSRIKYEPLDLNKRQRVVKQLLKKGWIPTFKTGKGNPQITRGGEVCPNLVKVSGVGEDLSMFYILSHRRSQIRGWLDSVRADRRLSASAIVNGTNTARMTHRLVVNVPKAAPHVVLGQEMRELFTVPTKYNGGGTSNKVLMGVDAKGLELRMLCHYMNDPDYTKTLLTGDIHAENQKMAGLATRDSAKTFIYAFLYGAGHAKLGSILGGGSREGKAAKARFLQNLPALERLITKVSKASERGHLKGIDGRLIYMRRDQNGHIATHKALNTLLQSAGSIVMKMAAILFDQHLKNRKLDKVCHQVLNMHDEFQCEVDDDLSVMTKVRDLMLDSIEEAGEYFNLRIPLEGEVKVGANWAETH